MNAREFSEHSWLAANGSANSQRALAKHFSSVGDAALAEFWEAKANGDPAFTPENFRARKSGSIS